MGIRKISQLDEVEKKKCVFQTQRHIIPDLFENEIEFKAPGSVLAYVQNPDLIQTEDQRQTIERILHTLFELSFPREKLQTSQSYDEQEYFDSYSVNLGDLQDILGISEAYELASIAYNTFMTWVVNPVLPNPVLSGDVWIGGRKVGNTTCSYDTTSTGYGSNLDTLSSNPHDIYIHDKTWLHIAAKETNVYGKLTIHSDNCEGNSERKFSVHGNSEFFGRIKGRAIQACWADLAENYEADCEYDPGTLIKFGGEKEITVASGNANGVVTTKPGFVLNAENGEAKQMVGIALTGRTSVKIIGPVKKFDKIVLSATPGVGIACNSPEATPSLLIKNDVIGRALEDNDDTGVKLVECAVQMNLN